MHRGVQGPVGPGHVTSALEATWSPHVERIYERCLLHAPKLGLVKMEKSLKRTRKTVVSSMRGNDVIWKEDQRCR